MYQRAGCSLRIPESTYGGGVRAAGDSGNPGDHNGKSSTRDSKQKNGSANDIQRRLPNPRDDTITAGPGQRTGSGSKIKSRQGKADMPYLVKEAVVRTWPIQQVPPLHPIRILRRCGEPTMKVAQVGNSSVTPLWAPSAQRFFC